MALIVLMIILAIVVSAGLFLVPHLRTSVGARFRLWRLALLAATLGWLLANGLLLADAHPPGLALFAGSLLAVVGATLGARWRKLRSFEAAGFSLVCVMLSWPVLWVVAVVVGSYLGIVTWE